MIATRIERLIPDATGVLAILIMACAFLLSFANLQAGAVQAGISPFLSWAWPVCIDALLIAGSRSPHYPDGKYRDVHDDHQV